MKNKSKKSDNNYFCINNPDYFLTFSDLRISDGIDIVENILIISNKHVKDNKDDIKLMENIEQYKDENKIEGSYISTLTNKFDILENKYNKFKIFNIISSNISVKNYTKELKNVEIKNKTNYLDINQIITIDYALSPKLLIEIYKTCLKTKTEFFKDLRLPKHIEKILNKNEFLVISSKLPKESFNEEYIMDNGLDITEMKYDDNKINKKQFLNEIKEKIIENLIESLDQLKIDFGILDYIEAEGIKIDDMIDSGLELCVGVEKSEELKEKLRKQILKSLTDINVIALLMAAIRTEEDFQNNHLREVDVSDDPAYLYTDEVLGLAISNQIAGTKAQFNFKRYDENKPGILSSLGPMIDDIIAGLIAGCMSKIFEE